MVDFVHLSQCGDTIIPPGAKFEGERFEAFKAMAAAGKANGSLMVVQVCHPGRQIQSRFVNESISASAVPLGKLSHPWLSYRSSFHIAAASTNHRNHHGLPLFQP